MSKDIRKWKKFLIEEEGKRESTVKNYISTVSELREFSRKPLRHLTLNEFENYIWRLKENGMKKTTINMKIGRINNFYSFLKGEYNLSQEIDKIMEYDFLNVEDKDIILTEKGLIDIINSNIRLKEKAIITLSFTMCADVNMVRKLKKRNFIEKDKYVKVKLFDSRNENRTTKYIEYRFYDVVKEYMKTLDGEILFPSRIGKKDYLEGSSIYSLINKLGYEYIGTNFSNHKLKVSGLNYLYRRGFDLFVIAKMGNYKTISNILDIIQIDDLEVESKVRQYLGREENLF